MEQRNEPSTAECCVEDQLREIVRKTRTERLAFVPLDTGALLRIADIIEGLERENAELSKKLYNSQPARRKRRRIGMRRSRT